MMPMSSPLAAVRARSVEDVDTREVAGHDIVEDDDVFDRCGPRRLCGAQCRAAHLSSSVCFPGRARVSASIASSSSRAVSTSSSGLGSELALVAPGHDTEIDILVGAEICVDDGLLLHDSIRWPFGDDFAFGHDDHPVGDVAHHVHVVLDEEHRHAEILEVEDVIEQRLRQSRVHAGHGLVEHHQSGVAHERAGHLEKLPLPTGEGCGVVLLLGIQLEAGQEVARLDLDLVILLAPQERQHARPDALAGLLARAQLHVLHDREQPERLRQLEGADLAHTRRLEGGDAGEVLAVERPASFVGLVEPRQQVEQRRLAGAIGADERGDGVARNLQVIDIDRDQTAEDALHAIRHDDRVDLLDSGPDLALVQPRRLRTGDRGLYVSGQRSAPSCFRGCPAAGR